MNETIWVHVRNCCRKRNRTQVSFATSEEADGLVMVRIWIQELSEDVRRGRLQHHADITEEGEPDEDEEIGPNVSVADARHGHHHVQSEPERATTLEEGRRRKEQPILDCDRA